MLSSFCGKLAFYYEVPRAGNFLQMSSYKQEIRPGALDGIIVLSVSVWPLIRFWGFLSHEIISLSLWNSRKCSAYPIFFSFKISDVPTFWSSQESINICRGQAAKHTYKFLTRASLASRKGFLNWSRQEVIFPESSKPFFKLFLYISVLIFCQT